DELTMVHGWRPLGYNQDFRAVELRRWAIGEDGQSAQLRRALMLPEPLEWLAPSADGSVVYGVSERGLEIVDAVDGRSLRTLEVVGIDRYAVISEGVDGHALLSIRRFEEPATIELWTLAGERLDRWTLDGTTPTIIRAYTGEGSYHENILRESPTWPTALTFSDDLRWVAIGGSDSKVRLIDRKRGKQRLLEYDWTYEERRHRGANPDLNLPLALRFYENQSELLAAYGRGDLLRWRTDSGKLLRHHPGTCSVEEARLTVNRYSQYGTPIQPEDDDREACGRAEQLGLSPDGRLVVSFGDGARVRDVETGKSVALWTDWHSIGAMADFAGDGRMAFTNIYGRPWLWSGRLGDPLTRPLGAEEPETGPLSPDLGLDGQLLNWEERHDRWVQWDLLENRDISPSLLPEERPRAISADGRRFIVAVPDHLEVRERERGVEYSHAGSSVQSMFLGRQGQLALFSNYQGPKTLVHLDDGGRTVTLDLAKEEAFYMVAGDEAGERLLLLTPRGDLALYDGSTGAVVRSWLDTRARAIAIAPNRSWLAWMTQVAVDEGQPAESMVHLIARDQEHAVPIQGWAKLLVAAPDGSELLALTESAVVRIRPDGSSQRIDLGYVFANQIHYATDDRWLAFATYNRVDIRANTAELQMLASIFPLFDGGWVALSPDGAVEGNVDAHQQMVTLVTDAEGRRLTFSGGLGWDRFDSPGRCAQPRGV
ncbi:MAG: hypothetical protein KC431_24155, partial [Myxococcales bacterium]|nr:hypothetical protein [Myxococcales bacterium]